jgi:CRP-like cAMP-binding protein
MPLDKVLYESGDVLRPVYFPTDSIVSLVGNEDHIGIALFMGGETTPSRASVQSTGYAFWLVSQLLKDEFHRSGQMQLLLLRYTQVLIKQLAQTAVCNRHHSVDQQLRRRLSFALQPIDPDPGAHCQHARRAGVRREGVTEAAGKLHDLGVIRYGRGRITVLDRPKTGTAVLRVLCRGQEGKRSPAGASSSPEP